MTPGWSLSLGLIVCLSAATASAKGEKDDARPSVSALEAKARAAYRAGEFQDAADAFGALLIRLPAEDPARPRTQYNRGRALQRADRPCAAAEALFGYLSNPQTKANRESRRRDKAEANLADARAACARRADATPAEPARVVKAPVIAEPVTGGLVLEAGLGSGLYLTDGVERARTTLLVGGGWAHERWVFDLIAELAIETPTGAETLAMVRPGLRWAWTDAAYLRAGLPILLTPLTALGASGGAGVVWPADSSVAAFGEAGALVWFSSPVQANFEARLGVQAAF